MRELIKTARWTSCIAATALMLACSNPSNDAGKTDAPVTAAETTAEVPAASASTLAPVDAGATTAAAPEVAVSSDPDNPIVLPSLQLKGAGAGKPESRYYSFDADAGKIVVTATAKNSPSGATQALGFALYDLKANRLCFDSHGNTTSDKTVVLNCQIEKPQRLLLRLDLSAESLDYAIDLAGPITLIAPAAAMAGAVAGAGSTDIDAPTRLSTNRVKADGTGKPVSYYYVFNAGPGELTLTGDGSNSSAAVTEALRLGLYTLRSERLCELTLGNTTLDKRVVTTCVIDKRQPVILRADLSAETVAFKARFDGPYDFEEFTPPKVITIALDSSVLFDTGKSTIKPDARKELHEAAERVKKFAGAGVLISGHTDNVGNKASNQALSTARAAAVKNHLVGEEGIAADSLTTQGFGSSQPVADNDTDAGRARNRRVDVVISPKK
jgi:outer membrane protein OmpA-like peptidoglycan-associated protein